MRRDVVKMYSEAIGMEGEMIAYGHHGRPLIVFPSERGNTRDYEDRGMIGAIQGLIDGGRLKVYCVASMDALSWQDESIPLEERARRHTLYEDWIVHQVVPWIYGDCAGPLDIYVTGCSFGAFHAANFAFRRADLFPFAIGMSGVYEISRVGWGEKGDTFYFNNPMDYAANLHGDHLQWLRNRVRFLLVCGQGQWEDTTGALDSTTRFAGLLSDKGIPYELDLWGHDVPHDWPSWRAQLAHHLPRFV